MSDILNISHRPEKQLHLYLNCSFHINVPGVFLHCFYSFFTSVFVFPKRFHSYFLNVFFMFTFWSLSLYFFSPSSEVKNVSLWRSPLSSVLVVWKRKSFKKNDSEGKVENLKEKDVDLKRDDLEVRARRQVVKCKTRKALLSCQNLDRKSWCNRMSLSIKCCTEMSDFSL